MSDNPPNPSTKTLFLLFTCIMSLLLFLLVTIFRTSFHTLDMSVNLGIPSIQTGAVTLFARGVAFVFDTTNLVVMSILVSGFLFFKNYKAGSVLLLIAMGGDAALVAVLKTVEHVARPTNGIVASGGFSYPSGHSSGVVVFVGVLAFFVWQHWQSRRSRALAGAGLGVAMGIVGFDRVYLNVHWLSDVFGGWLLGVFWLSFVVFLFRQLQSAGVFESKKFVLVTNVAFLIGVVVAVLLVLAGLFGNFLGISDISF